MNEHELRGLINRIESILNVGFVVNGPEVKGELRKAYLELQVGAMKVLMEVLQAKLSDNTAKCVDALIRATAP